MKIPHSKVIIWGFPLHSHTASYPWEAYYKAFKYLGYDVYWFHDDNFPLDFDFSDCLFICEGFADKKIPLNHTSSYLVWYCPSPKKYIDAGVKRFIDVRTPVINHKDHIHDYSLDKESTIHVGYSCYFEPSNKEKVHIKNDYVNYEIEDFDKLYINWATNILPEEFNEDDVYFPRSNDIYFCGTISPNGLHQNMSSFIPFVEECTKNNINFYHNDPWRNPISSENVIEISKKSLIAVELRGPEHLRTRYVPDRPFKHISYGQLGITNSSAVYEELEGLCAFDLDSASLFHIAMKERENYDLIKNSMRLVRDRHTYVNRIDSIAKILDGKL